ncbi:hypothetical protein HYDPIDRAFT_26951 [Hydnomerulius pinastri MD-312]|nr:hypothetical protein HYDPIDRAFT_26951 [Hydnomerulius pinastri MD-312]
MTVSPPSDASSSGSGSARTLTPNQSSGMTVTRKRKSGRKAYRNNPYPKWVDEVDLEAIEQESLSRFFAMYASLPSRAHLRPAPQLSPISRLPNEILVQIFIRAIERPKSSASLPSQFIFALVCRKWYAVTMFTPECWATFFATDRMPLALFRTCIAKSYPHALHIEFLKWKSDLYDLVDGYLDALEGERSRVCCLTAPQYGTPWRAHIWLTEESSRDVS